MLAPTGLEGPGGVLVRGGRAGQVVVEPGQPGAQRGGVRAECTIRWTRRSDSRTGRCGASSRTRWALTPPTAKELTPARRGKPSGSQSVSSVATLNGLLSKSIWGLGSVKCRLGGICRWPSARTVLTKPAAPAAASACPMLVFTEPMAQKPCSSVSPRKAWVRAVTSIGSPSGVAVPWASTYVMVRAWVPAVSCASRTAAAWPATLGAVKPIRPEPSLVTAEPRTTARMWSPSASASARRLRTTTPTPLPATVPSPARRRRGRRRRAPGCRPGRSM